MVLFLPLPGFSRPRNQEVEMGVASLIITASDPLKFLLLVHVSLYSTDLEILVPKGGMLKPGNIIISLSSKLTMPPVHFELLVSEPKPKKELLH